MAIDTVVGGDNRFARGMYNDAMLIGPQIQEQDVLNLMRERRMHCASYFQTFMRKVRRWYDFYRGIYTGFFPSYRNSIHIPLLFGVTWADTAYKIQTTFGSDPIVEFRGLAPEDALRAVKVGALVTEQLRDCGSFDKAVAFNACADIYGTAIARLGWKHRERMRKFRVRSLDREVVFAGKVTEFDGPDWENVDILDFWPQPGRKRINDCAWVMHRYYMDLDDILEDQRSDFPMFDKAAVDRLRATPMSLPISTLMKERLNVYRSFAEYQARQNERYARPVEIVEMWGTVPREFAIDGCRDVVITMANDAVILRMEPNPFWNIEKPFFSYSPMPDPHYFHGTGKVEIGEKMQAASNRLVNQKLDALDLFIDPMYVASRQANIDFQNLYTKPGRIFQVDGPADDTQFRSLAPNMEGLKLAFTELAALNEQIQRGTGMIDDVTQGLGNGPQRETARGVLARREAAMTRLGLEARIFEENFVEPLANGCHSLNQQYLTLPRAVHILGSSAVIDPSTGMPIPQDNPMMDTEDLAGDYRSRAVGASQIMGKSMKAQNMMMALQVSSANPTMQQITNWVAFAHDFYSALDLDPNKLIVQQVPAINAMAEARSMKPEELVAAVTKMAQQQGVQSGMNFGQGGGPQTLPQMGPMGGQMAAPMPPTPSPQQM